MKESTGGERQGEKERRRIDVGRVEEKTERARAKEKERDKP